jgi:hypothetical protein
VVTVISEESVASIFYRKDGGVGFLQNVGDCVLDYTARDAEDRSLNNELDLTDIAKIKAKLSLCLIS